MTDDRGQMTDDGGPSSVIRHPSSVFRLPRCFGIALYILLFLLIPSMGGAGEWDPLINKLATDGFQRQWLEQLFDRPEVRFDPSIMTEKMKTLYRTKFGDASVRKLQQRLAYLGYKPGKADGKTGSKTRRAIRWFQAPMGLWLTANPVSNC